MRDRRAGRGCLLLLATFAVSQLPAVVTSFRQTRLGDRAAPTWSNQASPSFALKARTTPTSARAGESPANNDDGVSEDLFIAQELEKEAAAATEEDRSDYGASTHAAEGEQQQELPLPWSQNQDWALKDNLPKYVVLVPIPTSKENFGRRPRQRNSAAAATTTMFALWRTMLKEVPELAGYPIEFLQDRHAERRGSEGSAGETASGTGTTKNHGGRLAVETPEALPYLDDYEFAAAGGISGSVYGIPGLADGTRIETSAVTNVEVTLIQGFVCTSDGSAAYELGRPKREAFGGGGGALEGLDAAAEVVGSRQLLSTVSNAARGVAKSTVGAEDPDGALLRLGATTGILLAGATAMNMLAHHLTVNVFWV